MGVLGIDSCMETCMTCGEMVLDGQWVEGNGGEPVYCIGCYSSACDAAYETWRDQ